SHIADGPGLGRSVLLAPLASTSYCGGHEVSSVWWNSAASHVFAESPWYRRPRAVRLSIRRISRRVRPETLASVALEPHWLRGFPIPVLFGIRRDSMCPRF